ncbi:MAG: damage-control phosphatase, subfamily [Methanofollis sp.]|nr:damage-control phosphatase, subfamily [Methanofollis sp.]
MKFQPRCTDCLLSRVAYEAALVLDDPDRIREVQRAAAAVLAAGQREGVAAPVLASRVHRCAYLMIGSDDPYLALKRQNNRDALAAAATIAPQLSSFRDHVTAAVLGNTFDYGVQSHQVTDDFLSFFSREFERGLAIDDTDRIFPLCRRVVYITDNCGEIVFDRLLLLFLKSIGADVTLAVRGAPILNDATIEDAHALDLDRIVDRLTTTTRGERELGVNPPLLPDDLALALDRCTLVVAKGMANYESLIDLSDFPPVAHLMAVKCKTIAEMTGVPRGSAVALLRE